MASDNNMFKLPKLERSRGLHAMAASCEGIGLRKDDYLLTCFTDRPDGEEVEQAVLNNWDEKNAKAKSIIILTLGDSVMAQNKSIVDDDDKTAKELWDELCRLYTTSNQQAITNLHNRLNSLVFDEQRGSWDKFLSLFMEIVDELGSYDQELSDEEKKSKLLRTLPDSYKPIAMVCNVTYDEFQRCC